MIHFTISRLQRVPIPPNTFPFTKLTTLNRLYVYPYFVLSSTWYENSILCLDPVAINQAVGERDGFLQRVVALTMGGKGGRWG